MSGGRYIRVKFLDADGRESNRGNFEGYDYFWSGEAKVGDYAVVRVADEWKTVRIKQVLSQSNKATKAAYAVFNEQTAIEQQQKVVEKATLKEAILLRAQEVKAIKILEELAKDDTELRTMLDAFKAL